jgi:hypothetical protein
MKLQVQCYAGPMADERPVRFQMNDRDFMVEEIVDQWSGSEDAFFKVRADDGNLYILRRRASAAEAECSLEAFRGLST